MPEYLSVNEQTLNVSRALLLIGKSEAATDVPTPPQERDGNYEIQKNNYAARSRKSSSSAMLPWDMKRSSAVFP